MEKITAEILRNNKELAVYLSESSLGNSRKGDGVFVGGGYAPPDICKKFGIVLPKGGMIIPDDSPERLKGLIFSEKIRRRRIENEEKLAERKVIWKSFCALNDIEVIKSIYSLQLQLLSFFGDLGYCNKDPKVPIEIGGNEYLNWYILKSIYAISKGGLADPEKSNGFAISVMEKARLVTIKFNGKTLPFSMSSVSELTSDVETYIKQNVNEERRKKVEEEIENDRLATEKRWSEKSLTVGEDNYFNNGDDFTLAPKVTVGNNCYFSTGAKVGRGATIGNNVVIIGAMVKPGAVVPDNTILFQDEIFPPKEQLVDVVEMGDYTEVVEHHCYPRMYATNSPEKASSIFKIDGYDVKVSMQWGNGEYGVSLEIHKDKEVVARKFFEIIHGFSAYCLGEIMIVRVDNCKLADQLIARLMKAGVKFPQGFILANKTARYKQVPDKSVIRYHHYNMWCDNPFLPEHFREEKVSDIDIIVSAHF